MKKEEREIEFATTDKAEYLEYYVEQVVNAINEVRKRKIKRFWISDEAIIDGMFPDQNTEEQKQKLVDKVSEILGIEVELDDYIVDVATRLTE